MTEILYYLLISKSSKDSSLCYVKFLYLPYSSTSTNSSIFRKFPQNG